MTHFKIGDRAMLNQEAANALRASCDWLGKACIHIYGSLATIISTGDYGTIGVRFDNDPSENWYMGVEDFIKVDPQPAPTPPRPFGYRCMLNQTGAKVFRSIDQNPNFGGRFPQMHTYGSMGTVTMLGNESIVVRFDNEPGGEYQLGKDWVQTIGKRYKVPFIGQPAENQDDTATSAPIVEG